MKQNETLSTLCFDQIREGILSGEFRPGERLKGEHLRQRLKVGLSPIREALSRLATEGLVIIEDNKGAQVRTLSDSEIEDTAKTYAKIECLAVDESIRNGGDAWEARLVAALHSLSKVETGKSVRFQEWAVRNTELHHALVSGCDSPYLLKIWDELHQRNQWFTRLTFHLALKKDTLAVNHAEHKEIAESALQRDSTKAQQFLKRHITEGIDETIQKLRKAKII